MLSTALCHDKGYLKVCAALQTLCNGYSMLMCLYLSHTGLVKLMHRYHLCARALATTSCLGATLACMYQVLMNLHKGCAAPPYTRMK